MAEEKTIHNIVLCIFENRPSLGAAAAAAVTTTIKDLMAEQEEVNIIFAAAPSQNEFLAALIGEDIDWRRINAFHMDEYIGLQANPQATFAYYLNTHLFNHVHCNTVHYINGNADNPEAECVRYAELLQRYPTDVVCMGIGENNHIAFNDPPVADFNDPAAVKIVLLDNPCRQQQVNDGCFPTLDAVPTHAITLTVPALLNCNYIFCMVPGELKAQAVYHTFSSPVSEQYPSTALRLHTRVQMFVDKASAALL
jgi:glucosamine-6-phosphate deaminase